MKNIILSFCMIFPGFLFGQEQMLKIGMRFEHKYLITALDSNEVYTWVGTDDGIFRINRKKVKIKYYSLSDTGSDLNFVTDLCCMPDGCVWVATNNGLLKYDNYTFVSYNIENTNLPENMIVSLEMEKCCEIKVATANYGVMRMDGNSFRPELGLNTTKTTHTLVSGAKK